MIKIKSYGSGSKGNLYLVSNANTNIVLECGLGIDDINKMLNLNKLSYQNINACITSHAHSDHSMSIKHFQDYLVPCYCTYDTKLKFDLSDENYNHIVDNIVQLSATTEEVTASAEQSLALTENNFENAVKVHDILGEIMETASRVEKYSK